MPDDNTIISRYFLRKPLPQDFVPPCLAYKIHIKKKGLISFKKLMSNIDVQSSYIPVLWPQGKNQRGPTCGLYALETAFKYAYGRSGISTPAARKDKNSSIVSLRQIAKEKKLSSFGELFNVNSMKKLSKHFKFPFGETIKSNVKNAESYTETICHELKNNRIVIVSLDATNNFPGNAEGLRTHWALLFGYVMIENQYYFLTWQYGSYYLFSANDLYESNKQLPYENPRRKPFFIYFKISDIDLEIFAKNIGDNDLPHNVRYAIGDNLQHFKFSLFSIPVVDPPPVLYNEDLKKPSVSALKL